MNGDVIRTITIRGTSEGLDKLQADLTKLAAAHKDVAVAAEETDKRTLSLEQAWKRQTLRLDEAARAQANIARETRLADAALREGVATQAEHAKQLELINQRYTTSATGAQAYGKSLQQGTGEARLARHELINLSRQIQDVGVGLASGQSPLTVLVQQGTQIADVFATSSGTLRGFFGQAVSGAKTFLSSWGGIATAVAAVGAAAVYVAMQFKTASTTIEEALKEQNRLTKEAKTLIDEKATAEERANAQSKDLTRFQAIQNEIDLYIKLRDQINETSRAAEKRAGTPTQVPGEMGEAPTGIGPRGGSAGYEQIIAAAQDMKVAFEQGLPGLQQYVNELGRIGLAYPELAATVSEMIRLAQANVGLEQGALKAKALADGLAGIATNAQLAAAGLGSIAEFGVRMEAVTATAKAQAAALREIQAAHPGISIEVAKQLQLQEAQLKVVQARTEEDRLTAQYNLDIVQALQQNLTLTEAAAKAAGNRRMADEKAREQNASPYYSQNQTDAANKAQQQAWQNTSQAAGKAADAVEGLSDAVQHSTQVAVGANQVYDALTGHILDYTDSIIFWAETMQETIDKVQSRFDTGQFNEGGYVSSYDPLNVKGQKESLEKLYGAENVEMVTIGAGLGAFQVPQLTQDYLNKTAQSSSTQALIDALKKSSKSTDALNDTMQNALSPFYSQDPRTTKLGFRAGVTGNPDWLTGAGNANPLVAVLGAGATAPGMANGGSFVVGGGISANDNRMAVFPVASGEQIVVNRNREGGEGRGGQVVHIDNRIFVSGSVDGDTLIKMKVSRYQQAQKMRAGMARS